MASCFLFHGPGARQAALTKAHELGSLAAPPFGDNGLKVDEARAAVRMLLEGSISFSLKVIVVGPVDEATPEASDVLRKRIEEFEEEVVQPILWAHDLGGVTPTVRSRCLSYWSPQEGPEVDNDAALGAAWELVSAVKAGECGAIPEKVKPFSKEVPDLLAALAEVLAQDLADEANRRLWGHLRPVTQWRNPRPAEVAAALTRVACG